MTSKKISDTEKIIPGYQLRGCCHCSVGWAQTAPDASPAQG